MIANQDHHCSNTIDAHVLPCRDMANSDCEYLDSNPKLPIFDITSERYPAEKIVKLLLDPVDPLRVCTMQPLSVQRNATFLVDCSRLGSPKDLTADDNGAWVPLGKPCTWFRVVFDENNQVSKVYKLPHKPAVTTTSTFALYRYYGRSASAVDFKRTVCTIRGEQHCVLVYCALCHCSLGNQVYSCVCIDGYLAACPPPRVH